MASASHRLMARPADPAFGLLDGKQLAPYCHSFPLPTVVLFFIFLCIVVSCHCHVERDRECVDIELFSCTGPSGDDDLSIADLSVEIKYPVAR